MIWVSFKRIVKSGFTSFWRNTFISASSVLVMFITLSVIASTIFINAILNTTLEEIKNKVDINVYFLKETAEDDIMAIKKSIESLPEVKSIIYVSRENALADFKEKHQNDEFTLQALDELGENPLGASLNIRAKEPSQYAGIAEFLKSTNALSKDGSIIIDKVNYYQNKTAIDSLTNLINSLNKIGLSLTVFLVLVSILITLNTIRIVIFMSKDEISVMRLVGASNMYIRGPFVVSGALYGFISGVVTLILFYPITYWLGKGTAEIFVGLNLFDYYISNFGQIFLVVIFSGVTIGAFSSFLAVRKHLRL